MSKLPMSDEPYSRPPGSPKPIQLYPEYPGGDGPSLETQQVRLMVADLAARLAQAGVDHGDEAERQLKRWWSASAVRKANQATGACRAYTAASELALTIAKNL